ncbi:MAG: methyltransferase domain-containing protein [Methanomassiliicoccales archaeon]|nr:methyltransferase domain-containing protein [Methanomassiliicoccales archaeon]
MNSDKVQQVFGERAATYVNSASHTDQEVLARVRGLCGELDGRKVLDVATGTGHTALFLAPYAGKVIGLDLTPQMLRLAQNASEEKGIENTEWVRGDVNALPFPDASFDVVCSRRAPHHFPDLDRALREMARVLKAGGVMVIDDRSVPDHEGVDWTMNLLDGLHDRSHVREYNAREWRGALSRAGLNVREKQEYSRHLPLSSLTSNADKDDAARIENLVANLPIELKQLMGIEMVEGVTYIDHYFISIKATK